LNGCGLYAALKGRSSTVLATFAARAAFATLVAFAVLAAFTELVMFAGLAEFTELAISAEVCLSGFGAHGCATGVRLHRSFASLRMTEPRRRLITRLTRRLMTEPI
jgi:hypothetical protein